MMRISADPPIEDITYQTICDKFDTFDDSLNASLASLFETENFRRDLEKCERTSQRSEKKTHLELLAPYIMKVIDNPFVEADDIDNIAQSTGLNTKQIRNFFRNIRKRKITHLNELAISDLEIIKTKIVQLYEFISLQLNELESNKHEEAEAEPSDIIEFPLLNS